MIRSLLIAALLTLSTSGNVVNNGNQTYVYVCTGPKAKVYHKTPNCKGLENCSKEIKKVTLEQAQKMNRRACKLCY